MPCLTFLKAASKRAWCVSNAHQAIAILHKAIQEAQTPPCGPVSVEIPIDIQGSLIPLALATASVTPLAGAIGMGLPMAIGVAVANPQRKVVGLVGDGGLSLSLGELATLAQEQANVTLLIMNDGGYGVMRGIQDKYFGGRQYYNQLHTPDFTQLAQAIGLQAWQVEHVDDFQAVMTKALASVGPSVVEIRVDKIGALRFAGPPQKTLY